MSRSKDESAPRAELPERRPQAAGFVRLGTQQSGFTLVETLVVVVVLIIVCSALVAPLVSSQGVQARDAEYAYSQQNARTGLDGMVHQIRQAYAVLSTTPNSIEFNVSLSGSDYHVLYECDVAQPNTSYQQCVRLQAAAGAALPPLSAGVVVLTNVTNGTLADPVFTFTPNGVSPTYVTARIKVPASGGTNGGLTHSIVLSDGVLLRNQAVGS
jgi:prepilin-type N-terminal cleavage/methylation domain-containing protein